MMQLLAQKLIQKLMQAGTCMTTLLLCLMILAGNKAIASEYLVETYAQGLDRPWSLAFLPDRSILVSELVGQFRIVNPDGTVSKPLQGTPEVVYRSQGGLSDVILDPDYQSNQRIYFSYSGRDEVSGRLTLYIASARLNRAALALEDVTVLFQAKALRRANVHYGAKLAFLADGTLVIASGDGFDHREQAQRLDNHFGKMIRINRDGSVPSDNPFIGKEGALSDIYSYGHRNQQGLVVLPDGALLSHEHGPRGGDELNRIEPGRNYGWPAITYGIDYSGAMISPFTEMQGMEQPLKYWVPSIAPAGLAYMHQSSQFPSWNGSFFVAGLVPGDVRRLWKGRDGSYHEDTLLEELGTRIRNIYVTPEGTLMAVTDDAKTSASGGGRLLLIKPIKPQQ
ncbi:MAG: PQQ-dependent sugar dehydrogenase [Gammaproteobacteria bacterium]